MSFEIIALNVVFVILCLVILVFWIRAMIARDRYKDQLESLAHKSQLELDLNFATLPQLMSEIHKRTGKSIFIFPAMTNVPVDQGNRVHIYGMATYEVPVTLTKLAQSIKDGNPIGRDHV